MEIAHRDFTPIECLPDDCLLSDHPVDLPWGMLKSALETSLEKFQLNPHQPLTDSGVVEPLLRPQVPLRA